MDMLPKFPNFRPFTSEDISWYQDYYSKNSLYPYTDISPANIFAWLGMNNDLGACKINETVVLKYTNILDDNQINFIPLANHLTNNVVEILMTYLRENSLPLELHEVPSTICRELDQSKWSLVDDCAGFEYILDTSQQSELPGSDFSRQRRRVNYFERQHIDDKIEIEYKEIDDNVKTAFLHHLETMPLNSNEYSSTRNTAEPVAVRINLDCAQIFHKKALIIKINNSVVALAMVSPLDTETVAINHLKVDYSIQYIFQYTIYQLAKILKTEGIAKMNIEQDLGIEGLRAFKERLQPIIMLEKKIITPRHQ